MSNKKKILFLTGTRADFGKLKSLISIASNSEEFDVHIFATGMHMLHKYGRTVDEIEKCGFKNIYKFINYTSESTMDETLARTIQGFSSYIRELKPDLVVVHGDRAEALAGAISGALNNILVAHVEGGEVSGTIDELIRHAVSKMSHIHFVSNDHARKRLIQMGEREENIFVIGSPDVDIILSQKLPDIEHTKQRYEIPFDEYAIVLFHPVTTEVSHMALYAKQFVDALLQTNDNLVVVYPNNDLGSSMILQQYERLKGRENIKMFPSVRFEYFLTLLKHATYMVGNSSSAIHEAPYYGVPAINIGTRQQNRFMHGGVVNVGYETHEIVSAIETARNTSYEKEYLFGAGNSDELFLKTLLQESFWKINTQKQFKDLKEQQPLEAS